MSSQGRPGRLSEAEFRSSRGVPIPLQAITTTFAFCSCTCSSGIVVDHSVRETVLIDCDLSHAAMGL